MFSSSPLDGASSLISQTPVEGVKVVPIEGKGRGVVATRFIQPGEVVILEAPYTAVLVLDQLQHSCSGEFAPLPDDCATRCSACGSVRCVPWLQCAGSSSELTYRPYIVLYFLPCLVDRG